MIFVSVMLSPYFIHVMELIFTEFRAIHSHRYFDIRGKIAVTQLKMNFIYKKKKKGEQYFKQSRLTLTKEKSKERKSMLIGILILYTQTKTQRKCWLRQKVSAVACTVCNVYQYSTSNTSMTLDNLFPSLFLLAQISSVWFKHIQTTTRPTTFFLGFTLFASPRITFLLLSCALLLLL